MDDIKPKSEYNIDSLLHYYEVRMYALSEYSERVWIRFNWFLTLQLAVFGLYSNRLEKITSQAIMASGLPIIGIALALLWFLLGAEDYVSAKKHGARTNEVEKKVKEFFFNQGIDFDVSVRTTFVGFRQTWLLFAFPVFIVIAWLFIVVKL